MERGCRAFYLKKCWGEVDEKENYHNVAQQKYQTMNGASQEKLNSNSIAGNIILFAQPQPHPHYHFYGLKSQSPLSIWRGDAEPST
jgi:hypothetical protein